MDNLLIEHYKKKLILLLQEIPVKDRKTVVESIREILVSGLDNFLTKSSGPAVSFVSDGSEIGFYGTKMKALRKINISSLKYIPSKGEFLGETPENMAIKLYNNL
ncbi:MAG TPA: hypothetical protein VLB80_00430 [Candidatus Babeliales bacterium]|nr:hypothetical protein [Candidatus Babeliales bacterium]